MSGRVAALTLAAVARVMAGEGISTVAREMRISRFTIHRHLRRTGQKAPATARMGRPRKPLVVLTTRPVPDS